MLQTDMREAKTRVIDLNADEQPAKMFLDFLYFDELDSTK